MKYCIGCVHCDLMPGYQGCGGGSHTGPGHYFDPALVCSKDHWLLTIAGEDGGSGIIDIEMEMRRAETCPDYEERCDAETDFKATCSFIEGKKP